MIPNVISLNNQQRNKRKGIVDDQVRLEIDSFNKLVRIYGYSVEVERTMKCPCYSESTQGFLPRCVNCLGKGRAVIETERMNILLQDMNVDTNFVSWSEVMEGMVTITSLNTDRLTFGDRIFLLNEVSLYSETHKVNNEKKIKLFYCPAEIKRAYLFVNETTALTPLSIGEIKIENDTLTFNQSGIEEGNRVSVWYEYTPSYDVLDVPREHIAQIGRDKYRSFSRRQFPLKCIAKRSHFVPNLMTQGSATN